MVYNNYNEIREAIQEKKSFIHPSTKGFWDNENNYIIVSYDILIFKYNKNTKKCFFDGKKYSKTTSVLQNIIRGVYNV